MSEQERPYRTPKGSTYPSTPTKPGYPPTQYPTPSYPPTDYQPTQYPPSSDYPTTDYTPEKPPYYPKGYESDNIDLPKGEIKGYFVAYTRDYDRDPNRVLERKLPWYLCCEWGISGQAVIAMGGTWHLRAFAEDIGPESDPSKDSVELFSVDVDVNSVEPSKKRDYVDEIVVPATAIPEDGAYKVVVLLTHSIKGNSGKEHVTRMAGFVEIPMLQFYSFED